MYNEKKRGAALPIRKRNDLPTRRACPTDELPLFKRILLSSFTGIAVNAFIGVALIFIVSFIAFRSPDPLSLIPMLSLLALLPSNFFGGFVSVKRCGGSPFVCGLFTGGMWCVLSLVVSLCMYFVQSSGYTLWQGLLLHALSVLFCVLGALAGGIRRRPSKSKRRFG